MLGATVLAPADGAGAAPCSGSVAGPVGGPRLTGVAVVTDLPEGVPAPPPVAARSYLLADLDTGDVLVAKAPHVTALPASTLKTLTALAVLPVVSPAAVYTARPEDVVEGSKVGISPGSPYSVGQLLQGMMLSSGNDAATALARAAGGVPQTVARMQQQARDLGALDTVVKDPSGLDAPGQVTSAYDLALVARAALRLPAFRELAATRRVRFPGRLEAGAARSSFEIQNHNTLLANYPGAIGVKNGYTVAARWTVVGAATRGGRTYVVTALTRTDRSWRPTAALLDWAFAHGTRARPVGHLVAPGEVAPGEVATGEVATGEVAAKDGAPGDGAAGAVPGAPPAPGASAAPAGQDRAAVRAASASTQDRPWPLRPGVLTAAVLLVLALVLSARARRTRLRAARARPPARRGPRSPR